jgi:hypothetical protein
MSPFRDSHNTELRDLVTEMLALSKELRTTIFNARSLRLKARENENAAFEIEGKSELLLVDNITAAKLRAEAKEFDSKAVAERVKYRQLYWDLYYLKEDLLALGEEGQRLHGSMDKIQFSSISDVRGWPHPAHNFDEDGVSMGSVMLEKVLFRELVSTGARFVRAFPTPHGSRWADVHIRFTSDFQVQINVGDVTEVRTYIEMGFEDRRKGKQNSKPDQNWEVLRAFAESGGTIDSTKEATDWGKLEKRVQTVNARLKRIFGFSENAIGYDRKAIAYRSRIKVIPPPSYESR